MFKIVRSALQCACSYMGLKVMKNIFIRCSKKLAGYHHALPLIVYGIIYLIWFRQLETNVTGNYHVIHMAADDYIPFCEIFIIPYMLWFVYVSAVVAYFFFKDREDYYKTCAFLFTGMTIFLIVSTIWPNGHHLRATVSLEDNIFSRMVELLWSIDTPTNLWPSIHVYNSLGAHFAIIRSKSFENRPGIRTASLLLASSIIASTMLIKQHSVFDVTTAFIMAAIMYLIIYRYDIIVLVRMAYKRRKAASQIA